MKIGTKVSLLTSLVVLLVVVGISAVLFYSERKVLIGEIENRHLDLVKTLRQAAEESRLIKDDILLLNYLKLVRKTEGVNYGMVLDRSGRVLFHTDTALWGLQLDDRPTKEILATKTLTRREIADAGQGPALDIVLPVGEVAPELLVRVGFSKEHVDRQIGAAIAAHQKRFAYIAVAALVLGLVLSLALAQTFLRPIRHLAEAAAIIGKGKLDHTIPVTSKDELGRLAHDFNAMAEKLKELDQLKKDFVSSVTHELRSPLHSTRMYLGLFHKGGAGELTDKQKSYLKVIEDNTTRLGRFIDDLLDMAKIERGKMEVQKQPFDLGPVLEEARVLFVPQADEKKIAFEVPAAAAWPRLLGDADRTRQVLINLLSNAFKFTPAGGKISVQGQARNGHWAVSVRDTGAGIPEDQRDKIFEKFEQVKGVREKLAGGQKGTGLGLAIVKGLVEAQGGTIRVESELNKGSCFTFTIPLAKPSETATTSVSGPPSSTA